MPVPGSPKPLPQTRPHVSSFEGCTTFRYHDQWSAFIKSGEDGACQRISFNAKQDTFRAVSFEVSLDPILDLLSPRLGNPERHRLRCSFLGKTQEYLLGNCVGIPIEGSSISGTIPGVSRRRKYQLIAECGDLASVVELRNGTITPAIGGYYDFILRSVEDNQGAGLRLSDCIQRGKQKKRANKTFHLLVPRKSVASITPVRLSALTATSGVQGAPGSRPFFGR